jgi:hypothetical protein
LLIKMKEVCWCSGKDCNGRSMRKPSVIKNHVELNPLHPQAPEAFIRKYSSIPTSTPALEGQSEIQPLIDDIPMYSMILCLK